MDVTGIGQSGLCIETASAQDDIKKLLELQGELIGELLESARIPGPADRSNVSGMGNLIDIHI